MLSPETIAVIKQTIPVLEAGGEALTRHFYRRLFAGNPEVLAFFNAAHQHSGGQQRALAAAILGYARHIENPAALAGAVELIAQKHASLGIRPEHYPIVGEHLLGSIREVLGPAATDLVIDAWAQAYGALADVFIGREAQIYDAHERDHGWRGMERFVVKRKHPESAAITSFHLARADGAPARPFRPGQYVTVRVPAAGPAGTTMRNYSLSGRTGWPEYRISVKREPAPAAGAPRGHVSNYLHDVVKEGDVIEVGPPCGEFVLREPNQQGDRLVLISGGVGVTPVLSMLHDAVGQPGWGEIHFVHGAIDGESHAFRGEVRELAAKDPRVKVHFRYTRPTRNDHDAKRHHSEGLIDRPFLQSALGSPDGEFYFCGPKPMMAGVYQALHKWNVPAHRIHYEFFGPAEELNASPA